MKFLTLLPLGLFVRLISAQRVLTFPESVTNLPSCSYSALANAMNKAGCSTANINADTFYCICQLHLTGIAVDVTINTGSDCSDFAYELGYMCGVWTTEPSTSDLNAGANILKNEIGGKGNAGSNSASSSSSRSAYTTSTRRTTSVTSSTPTTDDNGGGNSPTTNVGGGGGAGGGDSGSLTTAANGGGGGGSNPTPTSTSRGFAAGPTAVKFGNLLGPAIAVVAMLA